jgi:DNA-binding transcriptional ArsR family regulator
MSSRARYSPDPEIAGVAALIGESSRAAMLLSLLDGRRLAASALALRAGTSPTAASGHLAKLVAGGLLRVERAGRQRLYHVANEDVAHAMEALAVIAKPARVVALSQHIIASELHVARSCYDHVAGRLGVALTDALVRRRAIVLDGPSDFRVTRSGDAFFAGVGIDLAGVRAKKRHLARQCLDWTERRAHVAGALGAALRTCFFDRGWISRIPTSRALRITEAGRKAFIEEFAIELEQAGRRA